jgi:hypothetical protein
VEGLVSAAESFSHCNETREWEFQENIATVSHQFCPSPYNTAYLPLFNLLFYPENKGSTSLHNTGYMVSKLHGITSLEPVISRHSVHHVHSTPTGLI